MTCTVPIWSFLPLSGAASPAGAASEGAALSEGAADSDGAELQPARSRKGKGEGEQHCKQLFHDDFSLHIKFGEKFYVGVGPCRGFDRFLPLSGKQQKTPVLLQGQVSNLRYHLD